MNKKKNLYVLLVIILLLVIGYEVITLFGIDLFSNKDTGALFCK